MIQTLTIAEQQASIQTWAGMPDPNNKRPKGATREEINYLSKLLTAEQRIAMMPKLPVTVVNINPYDLVILHPLFDGLKVSANKDGEAFSALVIQDVKFQVDQGLDRNHTPVEFWPIQLAAEFSTQYSGKGGVFHIEGDLVKNPELAKTEKFMAAYKQADQQMIGYCRRLKASADSEWNTPNHSGARNIHPTHRTAAKILLSKGLIKELPEWMNGDIEQSEVTPDCRACKARTKKGQIVCSCSFIIDPFAAFQAQMIDEFNMALERLTREQVEELGCSAYVAETSDERPGRLKRNEQKPLSAFEAQQQILLEAEQRAAA